VRERGAAEVLDVADADERAVVGRHGHPQTLVILRMV
jgi:hypothetical protein